MGTSFEIIKVSPLELTIDVDREICIEISTGFVKGPQSYISAAIPVTVEQLGSVIEELQKVHEQLKTAKKCEHCGCYYPGTEMCENGCLDPMPD